MNNQSHRTEGFKSPSKNFKFKSKSNIFDNNFFKQDSEKNKENKSKNNFK